MKKLLLILAFIVTGFTIHAQNSNVPSNIASSFSKKFPNAKNVEWERSDANYVAEFSEGKKDYEVVFDSKGQWLKTDVNHLRASDLPKPIQSGLDRSKYRDWEAGGVESMQTPTDMTYKVEIRKGIKMRDVYFDQAGNIIRDKSKI